MSTDATGQKQQRTWGMGNLKWKSVLLASHSEHSTTLEEVWRIIAFENKKFKNQTRSEAWICLRNEKIIFYRCIIHLFFYITGNYFYNILCKLEKPIVNECWGIKMYIRGHTIKCNFIEEFWEVMFLIYYDLPSPELLQQQEMGKLMYNGDNIFPSKKQEVYYSSNTSVSEVLDKNRRTQNNKDLLLTNLYSNKIWRNMQSKILHTNR